MGKRYFYRLKGRRCPVIVHYKNGYAACYPLPPKIVVVDASWLANFDIEKWRENANA